MFVVWNKMIFQKENLMYKLYQFEADFNRFGILHGQFILNEVDQEKLEQTYGHTLSFGKVLGKHSEIDMDLEREHIILITDNQEFLELGLKLDINFNFGYNPLHYCGLWY